MPTLSTHYTHLPLQLAVDYTRWVHVQIIYIHCKINSFKGKAMLPILTSYEPKASWIITWFYSLLYFIRVYNITIYICQVKILSSVVGWFLFRWWLVLFKIRTKKNAEISDRYFIIIWKPLVHVQRWFDFRNSFTPRTFIEEFLSGCAIKKIGTGKTIIMKKKYCIRSLKYFTSYLYNNGFIDKLMIN